MISDTAVKVAMFLAATSLTVGQFVFWFGRWTKGTEDTNTLAIRELSWEVKGVREALGQLRDSLDGRYAELAGRVTTDHQTLREVLNWKAGLYASLIEQFYPISIIDRFLAEANAHRAAQDARLAMIEKRLDRRHTDGEWAGSMDRRKE